MKRLALALLFVLGLVAPASAQQWLPGGPGSPIVCVYNASPPTVATANFIYAQCDTNGKLITSGGGGSSTITAITATNSHASSTSLGTSLVAKASAGTLFGFYCGAITGGAAGYCIAYNGTAAPSTGALTGANVLDACYFDTTARGCSLSRIPMGVAYSTGVVIILSSAATPFTYTTGTDTAFISADYQ